MKIHHVKHPLTALKCSKCSADIRPSRDEKPPKAAKGERKRVTKLVRVLGDPYRWVKFNRRPRNVRCMAKGCAFRRSDLTTSDKLGRVYDAQDAASDAVAAWTGEGDDAADELTQSLADLASELREVASEYTESADAMESAFTGGSPTIDDCREKAEALEGWADELESTDFDTWGSDSEDAGDEAHAAWLDEQRDKANDAVNDCPI